MKNAGQSVLWFLAGCLFFAESMLTLLSKTNADVSVGLLAMFGYISLLTVIISLIILFFRNPGFILAEQRDILPLTYMQALAQSTDPGLLQQLMTSLDLSKFFGGEPDYKEEDTSEEESVSVNEDLSLDEEDEAESPGDFNDILRQLQGESQE